MHSDGLVTFVACSLGNTRCKNSDNNGNLYYEWPSATAIDKRGDIVVARGGAVSVFHHSTGQWASLPGKYEVCGFTSLAMGHNSLYIACRAHVMHEFTSGQQMKILQSFDLEVLNGSRRSVCFAGPDRLLLANVHNGCIEELSRSTEGGDDPHGAPRWRQRVLVPAGLVSLAGGRSKPRSVVKTNTEDLFVVLGQEDWGTSQCSVVKLSPVESKGMESVVQYEQKVLKLPECKGNEGLELVAALDGSVLISDWKNGRISRLLPDGTVKLFLERRKRNWQGELLANFWPGVMAIDEANRYLYWADRCCIKRVAWRSGHADMPAMTPLASDMLALLNSKDLPEGKVTFVVGGKEYFALKPILAQRSQYFRNMFKEEWAKDHVIVDDVSPSAFKAVLEFLHSDVLPLRLDAIETAEVLRYADFITHTQLIQASTDKLVQLTCHDNVVDICKYAARHCLTPLRKQCVNYVLRHFAELRDKGLSQLDAESLAELLPRLEQCVE
eukprot:jgi/Chlat1/1112/Chrsp110S08640